METPIRKFFLPSRASNSGHAGAEESKGAVKAVGQCGIDMQPRRLLLSVAQQSGIGDPESCRIILSVLSAGRAIRRALGRELGFRDNSGSRFAALLTLYALDPLPVTAADLAYHAEVSRSSITDVIETLERRGLVAWEAGSWNRNTPIYLTKLGHHVAVRAIHRFLQVSSDLAGGIEAPNRNATLETCRQIEGRAAGSAS